MVSLIKSSCQIVHYKKRVHNKMTQYGFISTGNFNEKTAKVYGDNMLMTSNSTIMADINRVFSLLKKPKQDPVLALEM